MTYFNPKIFCKQNLQSKDRDNLDFWEEEIKSVIENSKDDYCSCYTETDTLGKIKKEIVEDFCEELKENLGYMLQDQLIGTIESYEEELEEVDDPETYN